MQFYRLYAGDDGQSHFEPLDAGRTSEFFNKTRAANGLLFRNDFAPHIVNYYRAPHRRWVSRWPAVSISASATAAA